MMKKGNKSYNINEKCVIAHDEGSDIIMGSIAKMKFGKGEDADKLTIVTLQGVNECGLPTNEQRKVLFWDLGGSFKLSERIRRKQIGDIITLRITFDKGDEDKCTALDMKEHGFYDVTDDKGDDYKLFCSEVTQVIDHVNGSLSLMVPYHKTLGNVPKTLWYQCFIRYPRMHNRKLQAGDKVFLTVPTDGFKILMNKITKRQWVHCVAKSCKSTRLPI